MKKSLILNDDALNNLFGKQTSNAGNSFSSNQYAPKNNKHISMRGGEVSDSGDAVDRLLQQLTAVTQPQKKSDDIFVRQDDDRETGAAESATSTGNLSDLVNVLNQVKAEERRKPESYPNIQESATSQDMVDIMQATPAMPTTGTGMASESDLLAYYIIFDGDFGMRNKLHEHNPPVFGKIRNQNNGKVPLMFNLDEAKNVAHRLIDQVVKMGTIGDKQYPVFGAIVLGLKLRNISVSNQSVDSGSGARDYKLLLNSNTDLVIYHVGGSKRGLLLHGALARAEVANAVYVKKLDVSPNVGFYLHNINPKLSQNDVKLLKQLYDANGEQITYSTTTLSGGNDNEDYKAYIRTKRQYLQLKKAKGQTGGSVNNDKIAYLEEKARYLQLKKIAKQQKLI